MYIENPNKKVSYSFRINPNTLEDLKTYAKATNTTVPEVINTLITEKLDGVTLTNDYLDNYENYTITIPDITTIYDNTDTQIMFSAIDLLNPYLNGKKYIVMKTPNNLDVWDTTDNLVNQHGYTSHNYPDYLHEGIEVLLAPELITPELLQREDNLLILPYCLLYIYFGINHNQTLEISLLTFREAIDKVKESNNFELMDKLSKYDLKVRHLINQFVDNVPDKFNPKPEGIMAGVGKPAWSNEKEMYTDYTEYLQEMLQDTANEINTGNIVVTKFEDTKSKPAPSKMVVTNEDIITEILEENKELQDKVQELEGKLQRFDDILSNVEGIIDKVKNTSDKEILEKVKKN